MFRREVEMVEALIHPPVIMPRGYFIMDTRPGALNFFRRLYDGNPPRPLARLAAFEAIFSRQLPSDSFWGSDWAVSSA
jgi:hypothetical protein